MILSNSDSAAIALCNTCHTNLYSTGDSAPHLSYNTADSIRPSHTSEGHELQKPHKFTNMPLMHQRAAKQWGFPNKKLN